MPGFNCTDHYLEHSFLVSIPRTSRDDVEIHEVFGREPKPTETEWSPECILRAVIPKRKWDTISSELRTEFNRRLKADKKPAGSWAQGPNSVQRLLGKELLVLVWAIEPDDVTDEETMVAMRNWLGLKPEERWWLYTMTAAETGRVSQVGEGWRGALTKALCFGTKQDVFSLKTIHEAGHLPPRKNPATAQAETDAAPKRLGSAARLAISKQSAQADQAFA